MNRILAGAPAHLALLRGMHAMTSLLRPTLGPLPRTVAVGPILGSQPPEVLESAAIIARRTIQLADPFEDMGAMLIRHLVWRVFERVGDGTATAAVLAQELVRGGMRSVAWGGNPLAVGRGMRRGLAVACDELRRQRRGVETPSEIAGVVAGIVLDPNVAEMIGEVVDAVGPDGSIQVEAAPGTHVSHTYLDGLRWREGYVSPFFVGGEQTSTVRLPSPRVLVTDYPLERAEQLVPTLEVCLRAGARSLLVVAPEIRDSAVGLLLLNRGRGVLDGALAVRAPSAGPQQTRILEDLAVVTGGRCLTRARHDQLAQVTVDDLGEARQAWASRSEFGILGGRGSRPAIRQRLAEARAELRAAQDDQLRQIIGERIAKLAGTAAVIAVGAPTRAEQEQLTLRIEAGVRSGRLAMRHGVVPGGGAALLACVPRLRAMDATDPGEAMGLKALAGALAAPMRVVLGNAGLEPPAVVREAARRAGQQVFDVLRRDWVDPWCAGIVDPLAVQLAALECSVSVAATALTTDVLVHRQNAPRADEP